MLIDKKDDKAKNIKKEESLQKAKNEDLFPQLIKELKRVKINVLIHNKYIFPKIGILGDEAKPYYIGHTKPVKKIVFINHNILCSISNESLYIKKWVLNNFNASCSKNIELNFLISDLLLAKGNNLIVCGEKLIILDVETEKKIIIFQPNFGSYIEFNLLAKINDNLAVASSLGGYFLLFDLNTGKKIKRIEMNKIHFICAIENKMNYFDNKIIKNNGNESTSKKDEELGFIKKIGSSKCLKTSKGHRGPIYCILGLNNEYYKDCIISGGFDHLIKIFKTNEENSVIDLVGHDNTVINLILSLSKKFLFSSSLDFTIRKWDLENCTCILVIKYNLGVQNILLPMLDDFLLSIGYDGKINLWNEEGLMAKSYYFQHGAITTGLIFPQENKSDINMFVFADHTGEIFIKQIIVGDENINNFNITRKNENTKKFGKRQSFRMKDKT